MRGQGHWLHLQRGDRAVMPAAVTEGGGDLLALDSGGLICNGVWVCRMLGGTAVSSAVSMLCNTLGSGV